METPGWKCHSAEHSHCSSTEMCVCGTEFALSTALNLTQFLSLASPPAAHCVSRRQQCSTDRTDTLKTKSYCQISLLQTWTSRCLMKFYASVAASVISPKGNETVERIEKRVLDSNPVMEAFGKCGFLTTN